MDHWIYEKTKDGEVVYDVYSKLLKDRILFLYEEIDSEVASKVVALLLYLNAESKTKEIKLYINSPGGAAEGFFAIYDAMNHIQAPVRTICIGEACSAAADLLASGSPGKREATPNAQIMIHSIQIEDLSGSMTAVAKDMARTKIIHKRTIEILADNTGQSFAKVLKDCKTDKYMSAQEALDYGIIDKILEPKKRKK
jgi:ATP-dependent Clp protease protease subunit